jgi:membrane protein YdbS with pleckstrin-like domain
MSNSVKLLAGERLAYDARPHLLYFSLPAAWGLGLFALLLAHTFSDGFVADALRVLLSVFLVVWTPWAAWHFVQWWFIRCTVSNYRVVWRRGVLSRTGVEIPLDRVSNVNFHQSIIERLFGAGDLIIESSGQDGQSKFSDIRHPDEVQLVIHRQIVDGKVSASSTAPVSSGESLLHELQELEAMRFRGALSDEEFSAAKRRLLGE